MGSASARTVDRAATIGRAANAGSDTHADATNARGYSNAGRTNSGRYGSTRNAGDTHRCGGPAEDGLCFADQQADTANMAKPGVQAN
jgi:hypothetical protein